MKLKDDAYYVQRKFWQFFGATVYVRNAQKETVLRAKLKPLRLKEKIKVYKVDDRDELFIAIQARQILDFGATYGVVDDEGNRLGAIQRKALKSTLVSDEWKVLNPRNYEIGILREKSTLKSFVRRYIIDALGFLLPQTYDLYDAQGNYVASMKQNMNPFIYKLHIRLNPERTEKIDDRLIVAAGLMLATIEGKE